MNSALRDANIVNIYQKKCTAPVCWYFILCITPGAIRVILWVVLSVHTWVTDGTSAPAFNTHPLSQTNKQLFPRGPHITESNTPRESDSRATMFQETALPSATGEQLIFCNFIARIKCIRTRIYYLVCLDCCHLSVFFFLFFFNSRIPSKVTL